MNYTIDRAAPDEFLNIAALDRLAWPNKPDTFIPDGEHIWRVWCDHATLLAAKLAPGRDLPQTGSIAGALVMFPSFTGELVLHKIMVHSDCRGEGIGSALMRHALKTAAHPVLLTVDPANASAVALYRKFGFEVRDRIDGYYRPHEDRLMMVCKPMNQREQRQ